MMSRRLRDLPTPYFKRSTLYWEPEVTQDFRVSKAFLWENTYEGDPFWTTISDVGIPKEEFPALPPLDLDLFTPSYYCMCTVHEIIINGSGFHHENCRPTEAIWEGIAQVHKGPSDYYITSPVPPFHFDSNIYWSSLVKEMKILTKIDNTK